MHKNNVIWIITHHSNYLCGHCHPFTIYTLIYNKLSLLLPQTPPMEYSALKKTLCICAVQNAREPYPLAAIKSLNYS